MRLGDICIRNVVCADRSCSLHEAAGLMRTHHVGSLVVVERSPRGLRPVGIVTDRDLVIEVMAENIDGSRLTLGDLCVREVITVLEDQDVFETIELLERNGIRRLPVVDKHRCLVGIVTVDDLFLLLAMQLAELSKGLARERKQEVEMRP